MILWLIGLVIFLYGSYQALTLPANIEIYRIAFYHIPAAVTSYAALTISFLAAISYLRGNEERDSLASESAKFGFLMALIAFITGAVWAKEAWGTYFSWYEVREVIVLVMLIVYAVYFSLRRLTLEKRVSAVYLIIAYVCVPFSYVTGFFTPLHPKPFEVQFTLEWRLNLIVMIVAFLMFLAAHLKR